MLMLRLVTQFVFVYDFSSLLYLFPLCVFFFFCFCLFETNWRNRRNTKRKMLHRDRFVACRPPLVDRRVPAATWTVTFAPPSPLPVKNPASVAIIDVDLGSSLLPAACAVWECSDPMPSAMSSSVNNIFF